MARKRPRKLISSDEAVPAKTQHTGPCSDCPWAREALKGWLGGSSVEEWLDCARGDDPVPCHALKGAQCAGLAVFRANIAKLPRNPETLRLPADRERIFATPAEFAEHHEKPEGVAKEAPPEPGVLPPENHYGECTQCGEEAICFGGRPLHWKYECLSCSHVFESRVVPEPRNDD